MTIQSINDTGTYVDADGDVAKALGFYILNQVLRVAIDGGAIINVSGSSVTTAQVNENALPALDGSNVPLSVNLNRELRTTDAASLTQLTSIAALLAAMNSNETAIRNALNTLSGTVNNVLSAITALQTTVAAGNASEATIASQTATLSAALAAVQTAQTSGLTSLGALHTDNLALDTLVTTGNTALAAIQTATAAGATAAGQASALTQLTALNTAATSELTKLDAIATAVNTAVTTLGGGKSLADLVTAITAANANIVVTDTDLKSMSAALNLVENNELTQLTALNAVLGAASDAQAATDTGTYTISAFMKRLLGYNSSLITAIGTQADAAWSGTGNATQIALLKGIWSRVSGGSSGTSRQSLPILWKVVTAATGYAVGDYIEQLDQYDETQNPAVYLSTTWRNITQSTTLAAAPVLTNLTQLTSGGANAALETGGNLATIATNTAQGTAATGVALATGGVGWFGWLSTIVSWLSTISGKFPALNGDGGSPSHITNWLVGQALKAASVPVVIASDQGALSVVDANNAAFQGVVAMTVGTAYAAQRSIGILCTAAGNVQMTLADNSSLTIPVSLGFQTFPFAVTTVVAAGTTATATYYNLK